jgi:hypothetical protein
MHFAETAHTQQRILSVYVWPRNQLPFAQSTKCDLRFSHLLEASLSLLLIMGARRGGRYDSVFELRWLDILLRHDEYAAQLYINNAPSIMRDIFGAV